MQYLAVYLILSNARGLVLMRIDKKKALHHQWRIPEATLMTVAALGGSVGSLAGMYLFRHKTRHPKFYLGIPALLVLQLAVGILLWSKAA